MCYISYDFSFFSLIREFLRPVYVAVGTSCLFRFITCHMVSPSFCLALSPWAPSTLREAPLTCCPANYSALRCMRSRDLPLVRDSARDTSSSAHHSMAATNTPGPSPSGPVCESPWDLSPGVGQLGPQVLRPSLPKGWARAPGLRCMSPLAVLMVPRPCISTNSWLTALAKCGYPNRTNMLFALLSLFHVSLITGDSAHPSWACCLLGSLCFPRRW